MMQTPKARTNSAETPQKKSPATPRTARKLKADYDSFSSSPASKTPKNRSPNVIERKKPASPLSEENQPTKVSELESQLAQLQEDLKRAKDQLNSSESSKQRAHHEAEEAKKQLSNVSAKLEDSQQQLLELSASEDARVHELRKISQDRDRAWQSELEAVQNQYSMEKSARAEIEVKLAGTLSLVETLKTELVDFKESEAQALEAVGKIRTQLETANATSEMLRTDGLKSMEAYNSLVLELQQSKARVKSLEGLVSKLREDLVCKKPVDTPRDSEPALENGEIKEELNVAKLELAQLRLALDAAEIRYHEDYIQSTLQIRSAYEQIELTKSESCKKEVQFEAEAKKIKAQIDELKVTLMDKETELCVILEENEGLNRKIENIVPNETELDSVEFQTSLLFDKERDLLAVTEKNEELKRKIEMDRIKANDYVFALSEASKAAEQEALKKLGHVTEEADKSTRRVAHVREQLDAAQTMNSELEAELRRLKVQSDQWRKAAEAATAILSTDNINYGKYTDRTCSLDKSHNNNNLSSHMGLPFSDDNDDDSPKKRNGNMLKKFGMLWKKGQK